MWKNDASKLLAMPALAFAAGVVVHQPVQAAVCSDTGMSSYRCAANGTGGCINNPSWGFLANNTSYVAYVSAACIG